VTKHGDVTAYRICNFLSPNKIIFGTGAINQIAKEVRNLGRKNPLIVTDSGVVELGLLGHVEDMLKSDKMDMGLYHKVVPEPPSRIVDECAQLARDKSYDVIIGIGGGSSLDVAKGVSIMATNDGNVLDYAGTDLVPRAGLPMILIPTTAGTGSEVTRVFVVTDENDQSKKTIFSNYVLSNVAIVDPSLTQSMPLTVTADTGIDALVHAIESYVSANANPFSDLLAMEAIRLVAENLYPAYAKASNMNARSGMSLAATFAGMAFTSGGLGAVHALAYPLGTLFHLSHGRSMAVMLPYVIDYNRIGNLGKYENVAVAMGIKTEGLSSYDVSEALVNDVQRLLTILNISTKLTDYGVEERDIPNLVAGAMKQARLFVPNPRDLRENDIRNIYGKALQGA
jgi:alcohol dehydrogenase class IV